MKLTTHAPTQLRRLIHRDHILGGIGEGFMDDKIGILRILDKPFIGRGIPTKHEFQPGVFDPEADRPITRMNRGP